MKSIFLICALTSLVVPLAYAFHMSSQSYNKSFWEFYPLLVSGGLLSLVFFLASAKFNTKHKSSS